ncbi:MAG: SusE domain-containing protein [Hymenobacter sp.]
MKNPLPQALGFAPPFCCWFRPARRMRCAPSFSRARPLPSLPRPTTWCCCNPTAPRTPRRTPGRLVSFGYQAAVTYTLQFDKEGGDFSAPVSFDAGTALTKTLSVADLNSVYQSKGLISATPRLRRLTCAWLPR